MGSQCYLPPDTGERAPPNPSQKRWYSIYLPRTDGRLSWPRWLATYRDVVPTHRRSPIQVLTMPNVVTLSRPTCYHRARPPSCIVFTPMAVSSMLENCSY